MISLELLLFLQMLEFYYFLGVSHRSACGQRYWFEFPFHPILAYE